MWRRARGACAATALVMGVCAGPAQAGTIALDDVSELGYHMYDVVGQTVRYTAAPGEANRVTVTIDATTVTVHDAGAPVTVGATATSSCTVVDPSTVTCPAGSTAVADRDYDAAHVQAGDGADTVDVVTPTGSTRDVRLEGGAGDDRLTGGGGDDTLEGGPGADVVRGLAGADVLTESTDGSAARDELDGGEGQDRLVVSGKGATAVDLASGVMTVGGGRGTVAGVEDVFGGSGPNTLSGDDGPNVLAGDAAPDRLDGRGGDDTLDLALTTTVTDFDGFDTSVLLPDRTHDVATCGAGTDAVITPAPADAITGCERLGGPGDLAVLSSARPVVTRRTVTMRALATSGDDPIAATLTRAGRTLATGRLRRAGPFTLTLTRAGRAAVAAGPLTATVRLQRDDDYDDGDDSTTFTRRLGAQVRLAR